MSNRIIKFRAWDKNKKIFVSFPKDMCGYEETCFMDLLGDDNYDIQQFTGLSDRHGKEIYEGDLFDCMYKRDGHLDHIYEVVYSEEKTGFILKRHGNPCPQVGVYQKVSDHADWRGEVIGNIYENKDLLK